MKETPWCALKSSWPQAEHTASPWCTEQIFTWLSKIKSLANSITLRGLSNYRASTTAHTCNLTDLVRVAQQ